MVAGLIASPLAYAGTTQSDDPVNQTVFNCNGDPVNLSGFVHTATGSTADNSPNPGFHLKFHQNYQDVSGLGASGLKYQMPSTADLTFYARGPFPEVETFTSTARLVSQGGGPAAPNFNVKITFHVTVNANGTMTSNASRFDSDCR